MMMACLLLAGCDKQSRETTKTANISKSSATTGQNAKSTDATDLTVAGDSATSTKTESAGPSLGAAAENRVPIASGVAKLTPENTKIIFVGTHVGPEPNPRTGGFKEFKGEAAVDTDNKTLKSISFEIETGSLWTQHAKLTTHLNSPDFFETSEYPTLKFVSKSVEPGSEEGSYVITGDLTLLKTTKEVAVPATVSVDDRGLALKADFKIDRTEFGMDRMQQGVNKEVALTVVIGEKTEPLPLLEAT
jgi:polyisoprenoid-binding protein YceI